MPFDKESKLIKIPRKSLWYLKKVEVYNSCNVLTLATKMNTGRCLREEDYWLLTAAYIPSVYILCANICIACVCVCKYAYL